MYGEIDDVFLANHHDYNIQIVSFGYGMQESVGIPNEVGPGPYAQGIFPAEYIERVQSLIIQLVRAGLSFQKRPSVLREKHNSHFMGKVIFPVGWAVGAEAREVPLDGRLNLPEEQQASNTEDLRT